LYGVALDYDKLRPWLREIEATQGEGTIAMLKCSRPLCIDEILASKACRGVYFFIQSFIPNRIDTIRIGAIMFGDKLTKFQCQELIRQIQACKDPFHCAHGTMTLVTQVCSFGGKLTFISILRTTKLSSFSFRLTNLPIELDGDHICDY